MKCPCKHIYAFDKDPARKRLLQSRMTNAGAKALVEVTETDFLTIDTTSEAYTRVTAVLLDPSCSGSGVVRDLGRLGNDDKGDLKGRERLEKLRTFQVQAIHKAMKFPSVTLLSYSTCSVWEEENESVVAEVLITARQEGWHLVAPPRMRSWKRRGHAFKTLSQEESAALLRCEPVDGANGFFVALFEKKERQREGESTEERESVKSAVVMSLCGKMIAIMKRMKTTGRTGKSMRKSSEGRCLREAGKYPSTRDEECGALLTRLLDGRCVNNRCRFSARLSISLLVLCFSNVYSTRQ